MSAIKKDRMPLGKASVEVEYEVSGGEATVLFVMINGIWIDADEFIAAVEVESWNAELTRQHKQAANEDSDRVIKATGAIGGAAASMRRAAA